MDREDLLSINKTELERLVRSYSGSCPRYTSYPTAVEFTPSFTNEEWSRSIDCALTSQEQSYSIYVHVPFCESLCYFCACNKIVTRDRCGVAPYIDALKKEIAWYSSRLGRDILIEQIHWGGGSPNYLLAPEITEIHESVLDAFPNLAPNAEVGIEIDARTLKSGQIESLRAIGFNRVSMGVQDFDAEVQRVINRVQSFELTKGVCDAVRSLGFSGLNIDLIYGLPEQKLETFRETLEKILELKPDRLALYGYAHIKWKHKVQKTLERAVIPGSLERITIFLEALRYLLDHGYAYVGLDHMALPHDDLFKGLVDGRLNRNFMGYTTHRGANIIGLGVSSISSLPNAYAQNHKDISVYMDSWNRGVPAIERGLQRTLEDQLRNEVIERIMCEGRVDMRFFEKGWGIDFKSHFKNELEALNTMVDDGLVIIGPSDLKLTCCGRLFARNCASAFDQYLSAHQVEKKPVFSQGV